MRLILQAAKRSWKKRLRHLLTICRGTERLAAIWPLAAPRLPGGSSWLAIVNNMVTYIARLSLQFPFFSTSQMPSPMSYCACPPLPLLIRRRFGQNGRVNQAGLASQRTRLKLTFRGAVQGVGFRPFIFRLATELGLAGWVNNSPQGVFIEVEGPRETGKGTTLVVPISRRK